MAEPIPARKTYTQEERRSFEEQVKARQAAAARRRELHSALVHFVRANAGWVTSPPGHPLRIETPPDSDLIDKLADRGFVDVQALGSGSRIEAGVIRPVLVYELHLPPLR
jgi:hypothetical protein